MEPPENTTPAPVVPSKNSNLPVIIAAVVACILGSSASMYFMITKMHLGAAPAAEGGEASSHADKAADEGKETFVAPITPFIVNLLNESHENRYLKCSFSIESNEHDLEKVLEKKTPQIRNAIILYLSSLNTMDLEGLQNKTKILEKVTALVTDILSKKYVKHLYIVEFVIQ